MIGDHLQLQPSIMQKFAFERTQLCGHVEMRRLEFKRLRRPENAHIVSYRIGSFSQRCTTLLLTTRFDDSF